jgi:hypothetical protein
VALVQGADGVTAFGMNIRPRADWTMERRSLLILHYHKTKLAEVVLDSDRRLHFSDKVLEVGTKKGVDAVDGVVDVLGGGAMTKRAVERFSRRIWHY